jgi:transcriptional antiterminator NusG
MNETDFSKGRTTTDPETDEAAELSERASTDEATEDALEAAAGPAPDVDAPPSEHDMTAPIDGSPEPIEALEAEAHAEQVDDVPDATVEEETLEAAAADVEATEPQAETEVDTPIPAGSFDLADEYVEVAPGETSVAEEVVEPIDTPAVARAEAAEPETPPARPTGLATEPEQVEPEVQEVATTPFTGPGDWYVIHTYAGYENKVKANLHSRISSMQMEEKIFDVVIPMEDVMEIKGGKKQVVQKKVFPGYLLVKMVYDNDSWYVVRNTPGVTGFVASGTGTKPTPLSRREVEKILAVKQETQVKPQYRLEWEEGDVVRIIAGPFADFTGTIAEINVEQSKLKVLVNIFDRETPVELAFDQVAKA